MRAFELVVSSLAGVAVLGACGGGGGSAGPGGSSGLSAKIDGQAWEAAPIGIAAQAVAGVPGSLLVTGSQTTGGVTRSLTLTLYNISGPGTYPLGVSSEVFGGIGLVGEGTGGSSANSWITDNTGDEGSVTIATLGGGRIAGTFAYTAAPGQNNTAGGTRGVTVGQIDLAFTGTSPPCPTTRGAR